MAVNSVKSGLNGVLNRMIFVRFLESFRLLRILLEKKPKRGRKSCSREIPNEKYDRSAFMEKLYGTKVNVELTQANLLHLLGMNLTKLLPNLFAALRIFSSPPALVADAENGFGVIKKKFKPI